MRKGFGWKKRKRREERRRDGRGRRGERARERNPKGHGAAFCPRRFRHPGVWRSPPSLSSFLLEISAGLSMHGPVTRSPSKADINHAFLPHKIIRHLLQAGRRARRRPRHPHPSFQLAPCSLPAHSKAHQPASRSWRDYTDRLHPQSLPSPPQHREGHIRS